MKIEKLTRDKANEIIETRNPFGKFYTIKIVNGKNIYVGIDNSRGDAWTEEFKKLARCKEWLRR